jgi:hypothetical protein
MGSFYTALAQICFALLGLWWVVVQTRRETWIGTRARRVAAYSASTNFVAVGLLALVASMESDVTSIWRAGSIAGGVLGGASVAVALVSAEFRQRQVVEEVLILVGFVLVVLIGAFRLRAFGLSPLETNAVVNVVIVGLATQVAWQFLVEAD